MYKFIKKKKDRTVSEQNFEQRKSKFTEKKDNFGY
jgi:hypothetical protein